MLWVHSSLVDTGLAMYETYVRRVEPAGRRLLVAAMLADERGGSHGRYPAESGVSAGRTAQDATRWPTLAFS